MAGVAGQLTSRATRLATNILEAAVEDYEYAEEGEEVGVVLALVQAGWETLQLAFESCLHPPTGRR